MIPNLADLDERVHSNAFIAVIRAGWPDSGAVVDVLDRISKPPPNLFVTVHIERRFNPADLLSGESSRSLWRVIFRGVGRTVNEVRWALYEVASAVNEQAVTINGRPTSPLVFEVSESPSLESDGRYSARSEWLYAL